MDVGQGNHQISITAVGSGKRLQIEINRPSKRALTSHCREMSWITTLPRVLLPVEKSANPL